MSGGTVDTDDGGELKLTATGAISIEGVVGQVGTGDGDGTLGRAKVERIVINSLTSNVSLARKVEGLTDVSVFGNVISVLNNSHVYATGQEGELYMAARERLYMAPNTLPLTDSERNAPIALGRKLVHLSAPVMEVRGDVLVRHLGHDNDGGTAGVAPTTGTSLALMTAGESMVFSGKVISDGDIRLLAGVDLTQSVTTLRGNLQLSDLNGGTILIEGQGEMRAEQGTAVVMAGGDVTLNAEEVVSIREVQVANYVLQNQDVQIISGYQQVAAGTVQVPDFKRVETEVTELVGYKDVKVGTSHLELDMTLTRTGYYNPNSSLKFVEILVEGKDYHNSEVNWTSFQIPGRSGTIGVEPPGNEPGDEGYESFTGLSDDEKWAVLAHTGYMPLYRFSYDAANSYRYDNREGVLSRTNYSPDWDKGTATDWKVYALDLDGMRDKYVLMPEGANEDILSISTRVATIGGVDRVVDYLDGDNTADGLAGTGELRDPSNLEGGTFVTSSGSGELVGTVAQSARLEFKQTADQYMGSNMVHNEAEYSVRVVDRNRVHYDLNDSLSLQGVSTGREFSMSDILAFGNGAGSTLATLSGTAGTSLLNLNNMSSKYHIADLHNQGDDGVWVGGSIHQNGTSTGLTITGKTRSADQDAMRAPTINNTDDFIHYYTPWSNHDSDAMILNDGQNDFYRINFDKPIYNPIMIIESLGQSGRGATLSFGKNESIKVIRTNYEGGWGSGSIKAGWHNGSNNYTYGIDVSRDRGEGNGVIRFEGVYNYIDFKYTSTEYYGQINVGSRKILETGTLKSRNVRASGDLVSALQNQTQSLTHSYTLDGMERTTSPEKRDNRHTEIYNWRQTDQKIYDKRDRLHLKLTSQARDIFDKRPDYQTYTQVREVPIMRDVTVYRMDPVYTTETRQVKVQAGFETRTVNGGAGDSLKAMNVTVQSGGNIDVSGRITAKANLTLDAAGDMTLEGQIPTGDTERLLVELRGTDVTLASGGDLVADETVSVLSQGSAGSMTVTAARDITFDAFVSGDSAVSGSAFTRVDIDAGRHLTSKAVINAGTIDLVAGTDVTARNGDLTLTEPVALTATGDVLLTAGSSKGDIEINGGTLSAVGEFEFTAMAGRIESEVFTAGSDTVSPSMDAGTLSVEAAKGIDLQHLDVSIVAKAQINQTGNLTLTNGQALTVTAAEIADGIMTITNRAAMTVTLAQALGSSDRNDIVLQVLPTDAALASAGLTVGNVMTSGRGDVTLKAGGFVRSQSGTRVTADQIIAQAGNLASGDTGDLVSLNVYANRLALEVEGTGDVTIDQAATTDNSARRLTLDTVVVEDDLGNVTTVSENFLSNGNFDLTADGAVRVIDLGLNTAQAGSGAQNWSINAAGNVSVGSLRLGSFETTGDAFSLATKLTITSGGSITEFDNDDVGLVSDEQAVDIIAGRLNLTAATGITGLETAINTLNATSAAGDIALYDVDAPVESTRGLAVVNATVAAGNSVAITAQGNVLLSAQGREQVGGVFPDAVTGGRISANSVEITSTLGSIAALNDGANAPIVLTGSATEISLVAKGQIATPTFLIGDAKTEYRTEDRWLFGSGDTQISQLPSSIETDSLILHTGGSLGFYKATSGTGVIDTDVAIRARELVDLRSGQDLLISGSIDHRDGAGHTIGEIKMSASGDAQILRDQVQTEFLTATSRLDVDYVFNDKGVLQRDENGAPKVASSQEVIEIDLAELSGIEAGRSYELVFAEKWRDQGGSNSAGDDKVTKTKINVTAATTAAQLAVQLAQFHNTASQKITQFETDTVVASGSKLIITRNGIDDLSKGNATGGVIASVNIGLIEEVTTRPNPTLPSQIFKP